MSEFHNILKKLRESKNVMQKDVANALGISPASYSLYEKGQREPSIAMVTLIANYFHVSVDYLIGIEKSDGLCSMTTFQDEIDDYTQELGEFLYYNPNHKVLFDASMEVKQSDIELAKQMLDRINGKFPKED